MTELEFIQLVKRLRTLKKLNQKKMASILQIPISSYSRIENGIYKLNFRLIKSLSEVLDIDLNVIKDVKLIDKIVYYD